MTFKVTDRRRGTDAAPEPPKAIAKGDIGGVTLEMLRLTEPEQLHQVIMRAMRGYLRGKMSVRKDQSGKEWCSGLTIPDPSHAVVEELTRYLVEGVLKSADPRPWTIKRVSELQTGDVITRYVFFNKKPEDYEVSVFLVKPDPHRPNHSIVKVRSDRGQNGFEEFVAPDAFMFAAHTPATVEE
jgi:hypothetical protein